ncbi:MAG: hypothetical protein K940chlam9_00868 [Chlamydiae bacterium]|nr:hypothetical protein [Chlamydiota bacterium]
MSTHKHHKVRLSVDCTEEERMYIKLLATRSHMTISEYLLSFARREMPQSKCRRSHVPNKETQEALKEFHDEEGEVFDTVSDFWDAMGMSPNAED